MSRGIMDAAPSLLIVDDDETLSQVLVKAFTRRGFDVVSAHTVPEALVLLQEETPEFAVVDLKMPGESGLVLVEHLHAMDPETRIVVLTGYASIATAIEAVKLGATYYLTKPATAEDIIAAFSKKEGNSATSISGDPLTVDRLEWEHIQKVLAEHQNNISATARALKMHRRTLQRKLGKRPVRD